MATTAVPRVDPRCSTHCHAACNWVQACGPARPRFRTAPHVAVHSRRQLRGVFGSLRRAVSPRYWSRAEARLKTRTRLVVRLLMGTVCVTCPPPAVLRPMRTGVWRDVRFGYFLFFLLTQYRSPDDIDITSHAQAPEHLQERTLEISTCIWTHPTRTGSVHQSVTARVCMCVLQALSHAVRALRKLHSFGYAHRDIKPGNILRRPKQHDWTLIDFGCTAPIGMHPSQLPFVWIQGGLPERP